MNPVNMFSQIFSSIGSLLSILGISFKDKSKTLILFILSTICVGISYLLINATAGMLVQFIFATEAFINYFLEKKNHKYPLWLIIIYVLAPCCILAITFSSLWDILPLLGGIMFPLALISKNLVLRLLNFISVIVWIPYCIHFGLHAGTIGCTIIAITNMVSIIRFDILNRKTDEILLLT